MDYITYQLKEKDKEIEKLKYAIQLLLNDFQTYCTQNDVDIFDEVTAEIINDIIPGTFVTNQDESEGK